ncbi:hypothetical protein ACWDRR_10940 [Kitasatospora sp. NPDC003701]
MAENEPTSTVTPSAEPKTTSPVAVAPTADAQVVDEAAANVAGHVVPADEAHVDPQELMGGEVAEPEHEEKSDKPYEPFGVINSRP